MESIMSAAVGLGKCTQSVGRSMSQFEVLWRLTRLPLPHASLPWASCIYFLMTIFCRDGCRVACSSCVRVHINVFMIHVSNYCDWVYQSLQNDWRNWFSFVKGNNPYFTDNFIIPYNKDSMMSFFFTSFYSTLLFLYRCSHFDIYSSVCLHLMR